MKKLFILLSLYIIPFVMIAQNQQKEPDVVYMKNFDVIKGILIEDHAPDYIIFLSETLGKITIYYKDIRRVKFLSAPKTEEEKGALIEQNNQYNYFSFAAGLGYSYAGLGIRFQQRFGNKFGIAYHVGIGHNEYRYTASLDAYYNEDNMKHKSAANLSLGAKLFFFNYLYINTSLLFKPLDIDDYKNKNTIYDISILFGTDYFINDHIGINAALGITSSDNNFIIDFEKVGSLDIDQLAIDIGVVYKIPSKGNK